jgi:hypothetical protein
MPVNYVFQKQSLPNQYEEQTYNRTIHKHTDFDHVPNACTYLFIVCVDVYTECMYVYTECIYVYTECMYAYTYKPGQNITKATTHPHVHTSHKENQYAKTSHETLSQASLAQLQ